MNIFDNAWSSVGIAIISLPTLVSIIVFGKSRGMEEAFRIGINVTFVLVGLCAVFMFFYIAIKFVNNFRGKK